MSKVKPFFLNCLALPPRLLFFSKIVTECPSFAKYHAEDRDENPDPIIKIFFFDIIELQNACAREDLNLHEKLISLGPQPSASTSSATRAW